MCVAHRLKANGEHPETHGTATREGTLATEGVIYTLAVEVWDNSSGGRVALRLQKSAPMQQEWRVVTLLLGLYTSSPLHHFSYCTLRSIHTLSIVACAPFASRDKTEQAQLAVQFDSTVPVTEQLLQTLHVSAAPGGRGKQVQVSVFRSTPIFTSFC